MLCSCAHSLLPPLSCPMSQEFWNEAPVSMGHRAVCTKTNRVTERGGTFEKQVDWSVLQLPTRSHSAEFDGNFTIVWVKISLYRNNLTVWQEWFLMQFCSWFTSKEIWCRNLGKHQEWPFKIYYFSQCVSSLNIFIIFPINFQNMLNLAHIT